MILLYFYHAGITAFHHCKVPDILTRDFNSTIIIYGLFERFLLLKV